MTNEIEIIDNKLERAQLAHRTEVLDKVKALATLPGHGFATTAQAAEFYEIDVEVIRNMIARHKEEFRSNGYRVIEGVELKRLKQGLSNDAMLSLRRARSVAAWDRKAVLNLGMLLRDSEVAKAVRKYLLEVEEQVHDAAQRGESIDATAVTSAAAAATAQALAPYFGQITGQLQAQQAELDELKKKVAKVGGNDPDAVTLASIMGLPAKRNGWELQTGRGRRDGKPYAAYHKIGAKRGTYDPQWIPREDVIAAYRLHRENA